MPTPIGSFEGARNAVISRVIAAFTDEADQIAAINTIDERLSQAKTPVEIPRVVEKGWLRSEDIVDVVEAVETNLTYVALMADLLRAVGKLSQLLIETRSKAAAEASITADNYISDLLVYLSARKTGGDAIIVSSDDVTGDFSVFGRAFMPKIASANAAVLNIKTLNTNGMKGNLLEVAADTPLGTALESVNFIETGNQFSELGELTDGDLSSMFEVEALKVISEDWVEFNVMRNVDGTRKQVNWNAVPTGGKLIAELTGKVPGGRISMLRVVPSLTTTEKIVVESVEYNRDDGKKWYRALGPKDIGRATSAYADGGEAGEGLWIIPGGRATQVRIRIAQDTPYRTKVATADFVVAGTTGPLVHGTDLNDVGGKGHYFTPSKNIISGSQQLERTIVARPADRWSIAIKEIDARANEYERSTVFTTKTYHLPAPCDRVGVSAVEVIPTGCSVKYEVSHDGVTWTPIVPLERNSGKEIVAFRSGGEANPVTDPGATFVETKAPVEQITLRISMTSKGTDAPAVSNLTIHPVLKR